jgi:GR25 family glycosyltransferase involved in LPS biosynthesis
MQLYLLFVCVSQFIWGIISAIVKPETHAPPHVLFVNLDRSKERRVFTEAWLLDAAVPAEKVIRISAVDASSLVMEAAHDELSTYLTLYAGEPSSGHPTSEKLQVRIWQFGMMNKSAIVGCGLSHAKAIAVAYAMGLEEALIIEDDISMTTISNGNNAQNVWSCLRGMINSLPGDWQILQLFTTIINPDKAVAMHNDLMSDQRMWSKRTSCTEDSPMVWGAGAYVISRAGMHAFLRTHLPQFLHSSVTEAQAFAGWYDFRDTATSLISDVWLYELDNVYVTHLPLFLPAEYVAQTSTIHAHGNYSVMQTTQQELLRVAIDALKGVGMFDDLANNKLYAQALRQTQLIHEEKRMRRRNQSQGPKYVLLLDVGMHASGAHTSGVEAPLRLADVTTAAQRLQLHLLLEQTGLWKAKFWSTLLNSYIRRCHQYDLRPVNSMVHYTLHHSEWLYLLVPESQLLRAIVVPLQADAETIAEAVAQFSVCVHQSLRSQCSALLAQDVHDAIKLFK